jgi:tetratricopeptide (TPR) repeat protein
MLFALALPACGPAAGAGPEATSLLGEPLYALEDTTGAIAQADSALAAAPDDVDRLITAGRVRRNFWHYTEAIELYTRAIALAPEDWRPYRFRGHRYISTRRFDRAIPDLERARELAPYNFDVAYHLGLAYYLAGRFDDAANEYGRCLDLAADPEALALERTGELGADYRSCMEIASDDDAFVAIAEWRYRALRRAGRDAEAMRILTAITDDMDVQDNQAYYADLLFYKGMRSEDELLRPDNPDFRLETVGYGIANWHMLEGDTARGAELLEQIAAHPHWPGFGRIAAEADLARLRR